MEIVKIVSSEDVHTIGKTKNARPRKNEFIRISNALAVENATTMTCFAPVIHAHVHAQRYANEGEKKTEPINSMILPITEQ